MPKFVIEREIPDAGMASAEELRKIHSPHVTSSGRWEQVYSGYKVM